MEGSRAGQAHDPHAALRFSEYRYYLAGNLLSALALQMQIVAVGWEIYERTGDAMALGWVGLVQVLPVILLALPAGHMADRFDRRTIMMATAGAAAMASLGLAWVSARQAENRSVQFTEVNRLVASFFNVIGITEYARVLVRVD